MCKPFRIAETATKLGDRRTFRELLAYAKDYASEIDAVLFSKVARAARNHFDHVEVERVENRCGVKAGRRLAGGSGRWPRATCT
jgi:hypothetical protein